MFSAASVCLSVCLFVRLFVCQHDNFRTIKRRMMKLGSQMHCTVISPEFECQGQRSKVKVTGDKKRKSATFCSGVVLWGARSSCGIFSAAVLGGASTPVGKSAHAV